MKDNTIEITDKWYIVITEICRSFQGIGIAN